MLTGSTKVHAHQWFFPMACLYAILIIPLTILARYGYGPEVLLFPTNHAFEMLFGFALALVAGYLLGPTPIWRLVGFMSIWLVARVSGLMAPFAWPAMIGNILFAVLLAWQLLPRLWVAKKWRNRSLVPLLGLICSMVVIAIVAGRLDQFDLYRYLLDESVQLFALLMLFMGGRMLAPAIAGEFYRQGMELKARVQPNIEAGLIVLIMIAFILAPFVPLLSGVCLMIAGVLAAVRLLRWRLWHCFARPDLICLGLGYGWLALGLLLLGYVKIYEVGYFNTAVHAITIGALGTLATNVMVRVTLLRAKKYPSHIRPILVMTGCMTFAASLRMVADFTEYREVLLALAALLWSFAFVIVLSVMLDISVKYHVRAGK